MTFFMKRYALFLSALLLCLGALYYSQSKIVYARIFIHAGPGIYLDINRQGTVLRGEANNELGQTLLERLSLRTVDLDTALESIVYALYAEGYTDTDRLPMIMVDFMSQEEEQLMMARIQAKTESLIEGLAQ